MAGPFKVGDHEYFVGRLNVRQQFDIVRRLGIVNILFEDELTPDHKEGARWIGALLSGQLMNMPQFEVDYILNLSLGIVTRKVEGGRPVPAFAGEGTVPAFDDIELHQMMELSALALEVNLGPFYAHLRPNPPGTGEETTDRTSPE